MLSVVTHLISTNIQDIPDEVSLIIPIYGCRFNCRGCHTPELREGSGVKCEKLTIDLITWHIKPYHTCITYFGGEHDQDALEIVCKGVKRYFPKLKQALYTGAEYSMLTRPLLKLLDYVKTGTYKESEGGLQSRSTNQTLYKQHIGLFGNIYKRDITKLFWH